MNENRIWAEKVLAKARDKMEWVSEKNGIRFLIQQMWREII